MSFARSATDGAAYQNLNPGNLVFAGQPGAVQNGAWAKFSTFYTGKQAQLNQLALDLTRFDTISELISDYAPPSSNDTQAYIQDVIQFFAWRNLTIGPTDSISAFIAHCQIPVILVAVNQLWEPDDWHAIQQAISQVAGYMPGYTFSCRYSNDDLSASVTTIDTIISPQTAVISAPGTAEVLKPYQEGQVLNVLIYGGAVMQGKNPAGGCEW